MNISINQFIKTFETNSKNRKQIFNDFLYHCFITIESLINSEKRKRKKDKYVIMRQNLINYLIANEKSVTSKLCR